MSEAEKAEQQKPAPPTIEEIDTLLGLYLDAQLNVEKAIETRDVFGEQIEVLIGQHGFLPPKAKKSKRIQGEEYKATLSQSHGVEIDTPAVSQLLIRLKEWKLQRIFRKLFRRETVFVLNDGAQELITKTAIKMPGIAGDLQILFAKTLRIESRSQTLKVELLKQDKKEKEK